MMKCESFLFLIILVQVSSVVKNGGLSREKRTLVWPKGDNRLLAICGFGIPVDLKPQTVIVGTVFKANYRLPTNTSQLTEPFVTYARKKRTLNRWDLYGLLAQALEMRGFNGKSCILRAICEVAHTPLVRNFGFFHEVVHTFFTPTSTRERINHHSDNEYYAAEIYGKTRKSCEKIFKDCTNSFLDTFTFFERSARLIL